MQIRTGGMIIFDLTAIGVFCIFASKGIYYTAEWIDSQLPNFFYGWLFVCLAFVINKVYWLDAYIKKYYPVWWHNRLNFYKGDEF
jgi:hypothetical protein